MLQHLVAANQVITHQLHDAQLHDLPSIDSVVKMHNIHPVMFEAGFLLIQLTLGNELSISELRYVYRARGNGGRYVFLNNIGMLKRESLHRKRRYNDRKRLPASAAR